MGASSSTADPRFFSDPVTPAAPAPDPFANAPAPTPPVTIEPTPADPIPAERPS